MVTVPTQYTRISRNAGSEIRYWSKVSALTLSGGAGTTLSVLRGSDDITLKDSDVVVTDVTVAWKPVASAVGDAAYLQLNPEARVAAAAVLDVITATADWTVVNWHGSVLCDWAGVLPTATIFALFHTTGNFPATDLFVITICGKTIAKIQTDISAAPVTLEGYKWPLLRR